MAPPRKKRRLEIVPRQDEKGSKTHTPQINHDGKSSTPRRKADVLLESRKKLPIWSHADEIRHRVRENNVLLLVGETGSGKSTQIPQFLHLEDWCSPQSTHLSSRKHHGQDKSETPKSDQKIGGRIAIIQPRRVAAISLATRVAAELGTPLGSASPASTVGYSVRFDNNVSPSNRIKFLTDGMLLQELLRDPWLRDYSCVIVDEVHERGINVDLALGFLRRILDASSGKKEKDGRDGVPLKVVVMSATAEMASIEKFFGQDAAAQEINDENPNDDWTGFSDDESNAKFSRDNDQTTSDCRIRVSSCFIEGRQYPVSMLYAPNPVTNILDTTMEKIIHIHQHTPLPGDVLVFLSGQEMIESLESLCHTYASTLNESNIQGAQSTSKSPQSKLPSLQILPLFASLPTHLQSRIFQPTPPFTRRIILATNIAETSITVPGIRHVIDTGKHKSRLFRPGLNLDTLLSTPISQSMAKQRAGRAGREAAGQCYRLYTQKDYLDLEKDTKPEILSTDLAFMVLTLKAHGIDNVLEFPLLTRPPRRSLEAALEGLLSLDALDVDTGKITEIGRKMATLPVRPDLARILLESTKHSEEITEGVIDIVSALSLEEGIFLPTHQGNKRHSNLNNSKKNTTTRELLINKKNPNNDSVNIGSDSDSDNPANPIETARRTLLSRHSDHLTLLNAIQAYSAPSTHDRRAWCNTHGISHRAMSRIMDVRKQLRQMLSSPKHRLSGASADTGKHTNGEAGQISLALSEMMSKETILKCLVTGLWTNIALLSSIAPTSQGAQNGGDQQNMKTNPNQRAPYTTLLTGQGIHIHPSSVLFTQRGGGGGGLSKGNETDGKGRVNRTSNMPRAIVFTDLVYTSKAYARNVSAAELSWVVEMGKL